VSNDKDVKRLQSAPFCPTRIDLQSCRPTRVYTLQILVIKASD